jgi:lipopolysaccharide transport system permease protein
MSDDSVHWDLVIQPKSKWYDLRLKEIWKYRDLLFLFVKRDFVSTYKQTILGPTWFLIQPILTTLTFTVIFGGLAKISTDGIDAPLFYLTGLTLWTFFADCLSKTSDTFTVNANVFGKVYFPRMVMPLSVVFSSFIKLGVQFILFLSVWFFYYVIKGRDLHPNITILLIPFLMILMGGLGLGFGIIISAMTTKYKDLRFLVGFGVQLLMYATPVVYPLSIVAGKKKLLVLANPMTSIIETFKYAFLGTGELNWGALLYSTVFCIILITIGLIIFNRVEKSFMDTV